MYCVFGQKVDKGEGGRPLCMDPKNNAKFTLLNQGMYLCDVDDEVHQLLDGDGLVPVGVCQPHHLPGDALGGHDGVEGVAGDGVVLADEVRHRLQQLDDVAAVVVLHHVDAKCGRED